MKQLRDAGAEKVLRETASGAKSDRAALRRLLDQLDADDVLMVTRLDRLARSTRDLLNVLARSTPRARVSVPWRYMGGHHDRPRAADPDRPRRPGRVRGDLINAHRRRPRPCVARRREAWAASRP